MKTLVLGLTAVAAFAAGPPMITGLEPRGAQKGRPFTLTMTGREIGEVLRVHSTVPATFTPLTPEKPYTAAFLVEPAADVAVGIYPIRVETANGISNIQLFSIGVFPEMAEDESRPGALPHGNDSIETAQPLPAGNVTVNGMLRGAERDMYRWQAKAGEKRVFELEGRRIGSAVDPVIRVMDSTGKQLARSEDSAMLGLDSRLEFTPPRDGYYYVEVTDARFSMQAANFYRLKTGSFVYPTELFPLGGRRGESVEVSLGGGLKTTADLKQVSAKVPVTQVNLKDAATLPITFDLGNYPEVAEPVAQALDLPVTVNGRLAKPAESDKFQLNVKPGDDLIIEVHARELGTSKLMAVLTVTDEKGKRIVRAGDEPLPEELYSVTNSKTAGDPYVAFKVPEGVTKLNVAIEDLALRGGTQYAYRVAAWKESNSFKATIGSPYINIPAGGTVLVPVTVNRRGYDGDLQFRVANPPKGLIVEGGYIPSESSEYIQGNRGFIRRGTLLLSAEPGVKIAPTELTIEAVGTLPNGTKITHRAEGPGMQVAVTGAVNQGALDRQRPVTAEWLGMELPAAGTRALPAKLEVKLESSTRKATGDELRFRWTWTARGVDLPPTVTMEMVGAADVRAIEMQVDPKDPNSGTFLVTTTKLTRPGRYDFYVAGSIKVDGQQEIVYSRPLLLNIEPFKENLSADASTGSR